MKQLKNYIKINNFAVLLCNSTVAKAYLQSMLLNGLVPAKIIYLDSRNLKPKDSLLTKVYKRLPTKIQLLLLWPYFKQIHEKIYFNLWEDVCDTLKKYNLEYESIPIKSINDEAVIKSVSGMDEEFLLYTGPGIVGHPLLRLGKKVMHIHSGYLPKVRGSHGIFWSIITRKNCGMACFFMNKDIDAGDVILKKEYPLPKISIPRWLSFLPRFHLLLLSYAIEYYYDAWLRSRLLLDVLNQYIKDKKFYSLAQDIQDGEFYYLMHPILMGRVIKDCCY